MIGRQLLHYRLEERLGAGAMGEVYRALDQRLGRAVAIKVLPEGREVDEDRFHHEARSLAALNHPHIVTLHALEEDEGVRFLVMELVEGENLDFQIPLEGLAESEVLRLALPLVEAVSAAHGRGIVHRDLKPSNVMIGQDSRPKILDFGLAQPIREAADEERTLTEAAAVSGTVPYMAPEVLRGRPHEMASDLFSLGVLLFQVATGERPFRGETPIDVVVSILEDPPLDPQELRPGLSDELAAILLRCLEKDPRRRYASAAELLADFERLRDGRRLERSTLTTVFVRRMKRRRRGLLAVAALVLALSIGLAWFVGRPLRVAAHEEQRTIAVLPFEDLGPGADAYFTLGVTEEIVSRLSTVRQLGVIARSSARQLADGERPTGEASRELGIDYLLEGSVRWGRGEGDTRRVRVTPRLIDVEAGTQLWSKSYDRVLEDLFTVQTDIAREVVNQLGVTLFPAEQQALEERMTGNAEAYQAYLGAMQDVTKYSDRQAQEEVVRLLERAVTLDPDFVEAWAQLGWTHAQQYHFGLDRTPERIEKSRRALDRARLVDPASPVLRLAEGYYAYWLEQDHGRALEELHLAARGMPGEARIPETEGYILRRQGRFRESLDRLRAAVVLDPLGSNLHREIGGTLTYLRRYDEALLAYDRAKQLTADPLLAYLYAARVHWLRGDLEAARRELEAMPPPAGDPLATLFWFRQELYEGDIDAALGRLEESTAQVIRWTTESLPLGLLEAEAHLARGDRDAASKAFARALTTLDTEGDGSYQDPRQMSARALALAGLGREAEARDQLDTVFELVAFERDAIFYLDKRLDLAYLEVLTGHEEAAFEVLKDLLERPSMVSPDLLRLDPRWQSLGGRFGF